MGYVTHFFLGANSGDGFQSLFRQLTEDRTLYDLVILKGGPGSGKSTFLKQVGQAMEETGTPVEYIHCAGDPDSLDGVLLPELGCGLVDGTPPHALEPVYAGAVQRCVDLGRFCDLTAAKAAREEIISRTDRIRLAYDRAFHSLKAARQVELDARAAAWEAMDWRKLDRRITGIISREIRRAGGQQGKTLRRFLGSATCQGTVRRFDTVEVLCPRVYELADSYGLAGRALARLQRAAEDKGWDTVACMAPEEPRRLEHLLIPGFGLAFVTSGPEGTYGGKVCRRVRVDAMTQPENRARLRFEGRMVRMLREDAAAALQEAKVEHDSLEAIYNPYVDFDGVRALAAVETARLISWKERPAG